MAKSAVLTQPSRIFLPISAAAFVLAVVYGAFTGDWLAITLLLLLSGIAGFAGVVVAGFRVNDAPEWVAPDADPPVYHEVPRVPLPAGGAWPCAAALAVTLLLLGFVVGPLAAYFGMGIGVATVVGWLARVSADTTGREINLMPVGLPVLGPVLHRRPDVLHVPDPAGGPERRPPGSPWRWPSPSWAWPPSWPCGRRSPAAPWSRCWASPSC